MITYDSSSDDELTVASKVYLISSYERRYSAHPINTRRQKFGEFHHLYQEVKEDSQKFHDYLRMSVETFQYLLKGIEGNMKPRKYSNYHVNPISIEEKLVITIRFLATGTSFRSLAFSFRMGSSTVSQIVREVCQCLWIVLQPEHMKTPTMEDFKRIAERFETVWGFPNCIGSLDGKHVRIKCPAQSGSMYFNYKHYFSIVLKALVDDHYRFTAVDIGGYGQQSDGGTFKASALGQLLKNNKLNIPPDSMLPNSDVSVPFVMIADEAYPLKENLMKPFPGKTSSEKEENFNKVLSRARKTVECAFGIIYSKWRVLSTTIETCESFTDDIIKAVCILHNTIIDKEGYSISISDLPPIEDRTALPALSRSLNPSTRKAREVREKFKEYFSFVQQ